MSRLPYMSGGLRPTRASDETTTEILHGLLKCLRAATDTNALPGYLRANAVVLASGVVAELEARGEKPEPAPIFLGEPIRFVGPFLVRHDGGADPDDDQVEEMRRLFWEDREPEELRPAAGESFGTAVAGGLILGSN